MFGKNIRSDFPYYEHNPGSVFLDSAASSLTPVPVIEAINEYYQKYSVNIHRGLYRASLEASQIYEDSRQKVKAFINGQHGQVVYTRNATEGFNLLAYTLEKVTDQLRILPAWQEELQPGDVIIISESEHHANIVPWHMLAEKKKLRLEYIPVDKVTGELDGQAFEQMKAKLASSRVRLVSLSQVSNVSGIIHDLTMFRDYARQRGALFVVDGAQSICHQKVDVQALDADFFMFSAHKMLGPTGLGVLWGKQELLEQLPPFNGGGDMIDLVTKEKITYNVVPYRFEAGTPHIAGVFGLVAAIDYLEKLGMENIHQHERELLLYALQKMEEQNIHIYGPGYEDVRSGRVDKAAVISFGIGGIHPHDIGTLLDEHQVCIRVGHHCCQLLMQALGVSGTARASFYIYNDRDDVDQLLSALADIRKIFKK